MRISLIIPAHNEQPLLSATLEAIRSAAAGLDHEVIVADDGSTDGTAAIARAAGATVVRHERRQIAATRNLGARAATGDLLVFVDADTRITRDALLEAVRSVQAGAVGGGGTVRFEGRLPLYARLLIPVFTVLARWVRMPGGCFMFCTRQAFDACGGWDERMYAAEESLMAPALKRQGRFVIVRAPVVTSGRKLRAYRGREVLGVVARLLLAGGRLTRRREGLDLWYGPRRPDPDERHGA